MRENAQRLLSLLHGGEADRPPYWEPWFCMFQLLKERWNGDYLAMALELGHAAAPLGYAGCGFNFTRPIERNPAMNASYGGGDLRNRDQLRQCPLPDHDALLQRAKAMRQRCRDAGIACWMVIPWCFHVVATQMGLEHFALCCYDEPDFVRECLAEVERRNRVTIERIVAEVRPDFVLYDGDCAYGNGTMVNPKLLRDLTYELTQPNVQHIQSLGLPVAFHSDGKLDDVIPLLVDLKMAAVHGCESQANDLNHLVSAFGDRIVLCGNMDVDFLHRATEAQVEEQTRAMLQTGWARGRYVACCNTSPQDYIPEANYRALLRVATTWRPQRASYSRLPGSMSSS